MARTPKPPKLKYGGLNLLQKLILTFFFGAVLILLIVPYGLAVLFDMRDITSTFDRGAITAWLMLTVIAVVAFIVASPQFWSLFAKQGKQKVDALNDAVSNLPLENKYSDSVGAIITSIVVGFVFGAAVAVLFVILMGLAAIHFGLMREGGNSFANWAALIAAIIGGIFGVKMMIGSYGTKIKLNEQNPSKDNNHGADRSESAAGFNFTDSEAKDDDFAFDPSAFNDQQHTEKPKQRKTANRSKKPKAESGRHPDDADLWEVVNDAASTAEERKTALDMILEREAKRN